MEACFLFLIFNFKCFVIWMKQVCCLFYFSAWFLLQKSDISILKRNWTSDSSIELVNNTNVHSFCDMYFFLLNVRWFLCCVTQLKQSVAKPLCHTCRKGKLVVWTLIIGDIIAGSDENLKKFINSKVIFEQDAQIRTLNIIYSSNLQHHMYVPIYKMRSRTKIITRKRKPSNLNANNMVAEIRPWIL